MNDYKYKFSVFTATLNGGSLLTNVYDCLKEQTFRDFEWVIVDDGSIDNTEAVCKKFIAENLFPIKYQKHEKNKGKHVAWRTAMTMMEGQYEIGADDDDTFPPNTLEIFKKHWDILEERADYDSFWEIRARVSTDKGKTIYGKPLPADVFDSNYNELNYKLHYGSAEMQGCRKVEVLRNEAAVPEHFIFDEYCTNFSEGIRWSRAARRYKTRFISDIVRYYNRDLSGRLTSTSNKGGGRSLSKTYNSLIGEIYAINEQRDLMLRYSPKRYLRNLLNLAYHSTLLRRSVFKYVESIVDKTLLCLTYPIAYAISIVRK